MAIRVVSAGTTIVKSITVGTPTRTGLPSAGLLTNLDDVVSTGVSDGEFLQYDSDTSKFTFVSIDSSSRRAISIQDNGGDGSLTYTEATGVIQYTGPSASEVRDKFSAGTGLSFDSSTGTFEIDNSTSSLTFDSNTATLTYTDVANNSLSAVFGLAKFTTDDLSEGSTNQYYTAARVQAQIDSNQANISANIIPDSDEAYDLGSSQFKFRDLYLSGATITLGTLTLSDSNGVFVVRDSANVVSATDLSANTTDDLVEGSTNLYLNGAGTTSDLTEGGNLYYTDARARSAFSLTEFGSGKFSYDSVNGILTVRDSDLARTDIKETFQEGIIVPDDKKITFCEGVVDIFEAGGDFFIRRNDAGESSSNMYLMTRPGSEIRFEDATGNHKIATFRDSAGVDLYYANVLGWELTDSGTTVHNNSIVKGKITTGDSATVGGNLTVDGNTLITGNLTVEGTTTTINSTTLSINDKNIVLADSAADSTAANGAGLTINGANATITYTALTDTWDLNKPLGTDVNAISNYTTTNLTEGTNLYYTSTRVDSDIDAKVTKSFVDALNVDADTLDGVSSESFLRSDIADIKTSGNLTLNDNVALKVGTGADLSISHDGNDTYANNSNGVFYIQGNTVSITNAAGTSTIGYFDNTVGARLYYNNNEKLQTNSTGITVTGEINVDSATISGDVDVGGSFTTVTTDGLSEGSINLYYTTSRADSDFDVKFAGKSTTDLTEGTNLYYTTARDSAQFIVNFAERTTGDLTEGSNLYYTTTRVDSDIDARVTKTFVDNLNVDADTLDNLNSTQLLRSDVADTKTSGSLHFNDNVKLTFGDDSDFLIVHNGSHTVMKDARTGSLFIEGSLINIASDNNGYPIYAEFGSGVAAILNDSSGDQRLKTHDSGVNIQGSLTVTGSFRNINTDDLNEGSSNLYYTTARHDSDFTQSFELQTTGDLAEGDTNLYYTTARHDSDFAVKLDSSSTDNLSEGTTNLYYTSVRADSDARYAIDINNISGDGSLSYNPSTGVIGFDGPSPTEIRAHFSAGGDISYDSTTGKFTLDVEVEYTDSNFDSDFRDRLVSTTTDSIAEGDNLYYTVARADSAAKNAISVTDAGGDGSLAYNSGTGVITYTGPSASEVRAHFSAGVGIDINSGVIRTDSAADVTFSTITNTSGDVTTNPSEVLVTTSAVTTIDTILHGGVNQSVEYLIHLYDSTGDDTQITKMLATFNGSSIASNEFGTVFTGSTDLGNLDITVDGTNINLTFERYDTGSIDNVRAKVSKTIIK